MDEPASRRLTPTEVSTEDELRAYVRLLMEARTNVRAVAAETGLSKTTVNELRMGRRRISLDALSKVVGVYAPSELGEARAAWQRIQPERRRATAPAGTAAARASAASATIVATPAPAPPTSETPAEGPEGTSPEAPASAAPASTPPEAPTPISPDEVDPADDVRKRDPQKATAANRWLPTGAMPRLVYLAIAVLAVVSLVQAGIALVALRPKDGTSALSAISGTACISAGQDTHAAVTTLSGAKTSDVRIKAFAYHLQRGDQPRLEIAGELTRAVPSGETVQLLEWADPGTVDSTADHHPGNGRYYPRKTIRVVGRCVYVPQQEIGYAGFTGIRLRYTVVLLPAAQASTIVADAYAADGLPEQDLANYELVRLGSFELRP